MLFRAVSDYTPFIISKTYKVNEQDVYETWTDANGITHRVIYRRKISGSFEMKFINRQEYDNFLSDLASVKTDGYYPVELYVNNLLTTKSANVFLQIEPAMSAQYSDYPEMDEFSVKVVER